MKSVIKRAAVFGIAAFLFSIFFTGCAGKLGYSIVLWNNPEHNLTDGTVCKVYIKSNILQVYVISLPGSKEKIEVPLWQLTEPAGKGKTVKNLARYADFEHTYATVKLDGLPIRAEPVNTAKQVYRLREGEIIRCLYRGNGAAVTNGKGNMSGEWLRVLTSSGTQGWCFSHNLNLFKSVGGVEKSDKEALDSAISSDETKDEIKEIAGKHWYPDYYAKMIKSQNIDLNLMTDDYGFYITLPESDNEDGTVTINHPSDSDSWKFDKVSKNSKGSYVFEGTKVEISLRKNSELNVQYVGSDGKTKVLTFIQLEEDVLDVIQDEISRRQNELKRIASAGPIFKSSNYGTIKFNNENSVTWSNYKLLQPSIISSSALGSVTVTLDYFIAKSLKSSYDGVLTMHFTGMEEGVNFLYKLTDTGLRLEDASKAPIKDGVVTARSASPMVLFFEKHK